MDYGCNTFKGGLKRQKEENLPTESSTLFGKRSRYKAHEQEQVAWLFSHIPIKRKLRRLGTKRLEEVYGWTDGRRYEIRKFLYGLLMTTRIVTM